MEDRKEVGMKNIKGVKKGRERGKKEKVKKDGIRREGQCCLG